MRLTSNGAHPRRLPPLLGILAALVLASPAQADTTSVNDNTTGAGVNQFQYVGGADWVYEQRGDTYQGDSHYDAVAGDYYQLTFSGTQARIYTTKDAGLGIMGVSVDGGDEATVDLYAPARLTQQMVYASPTLANGIHTLKVRVTGNKNAAAAGAYVVADRVDVTAPPPTVSLRADPLAIGLSESSTLSWSATDATSCSAPWTSQTGTSGSESVSPTTTTTYDVTCVGDGGSSSQSATVTVLPDTVLRRLDFDQGPTAFDGINGDVTYSTDQVFSGSASAKVLMQADSINRGWMWQDPSDFCAGSGTNDVNVFAPVGSNRSISGEFYITDPKDTVGERLLALNYDNGDCLGQPTGSILALVLDGGSVQLKSSNYGGDCAGCNATDFSPPVDITGFANQWVKLEVRLHVARDNTGWAQLIVNGHAYPIVSGPTLTTPWGNYNEIQWGAGWAQPGTATQYLYLNDVTLASF